MIRPSTVVAVAALCALAGVPSHALSKPKSADVRAHYLYTVADDFIVDVYYNGERVPDDRRSLLLERFGATGEKINMPVNKGDWLVFNVVNNRLRWGGAYYFAVAGMMDDEKTIGFTTELTSGRWSCCDNPNNVARFISERDYLTANTARAVERPWHEGDEFLRGFAKEWSGTPIWGSTRNTWLKFVAN